MWMLDRMGYDTGLDLSSLKNLALGWLRNSGGMFHLCRRQSRHFPPKMMTLSAVSSSGIGLFRTTVNGGLVRERPFQPGPLQQR